MSALEHRHIASEDGVKSENGFVHDGLSASGVCSSAGPIGESRASLGPTNSGEAWPGLSSPLPGLSSEHMICSKVFDARDIGCSGKILSVYAYRGVDPGEGYKIGRVRNVFVE